MASKLLSALCLALSLSAAQATTVYVHNWTGTNAGLGPVWAPPGVLKLDWPGDWGDLTLTWGTNMAALGTNGVFEVNVTPYGLGVNEIWGSKTAFLTGLGVGVTQAMLSVVGLALLRRMHPGRAASPEL